MQKSHKFAKQYVEVFWEKKISKAKKLLEKIKNVNIFDILLEVSLKTQKIQVQI